jgi:hypothetical protein
LDLGLLRDDGAVVYLNGTEVYRSNMPVGTIGYQTLASTAIGGTDESTWYTAAINKGLVVSGTNVIAVEVHQSDAASSDVSFDLSLSTASLSPPPSSVYLSDLAWVSATCGWGPVERDMSVGRSGSGDGKTITLNGTTYTKGLGTHALSQIVYNLNGQYSSFQSDVGIDDEETTGGSVVFQVLVDGTKMFDSGTMTATSATKLVNVSVSGANQLTLIVNDAGDGIDYDHADWAGARLTPKTTNSPAPAPTDRPQLDLPLNPSTDLDSLLQ